MALSLLAIVLLVLLVLVLVVLIALYFVPIDIIGTVWYRKVPGAHLLSRWGIFSVLVTPGERVEVQFRIFERTLITRSFEVEKKEEIVKIPEKEIEEKPKIPPREQVRRLQAAWPYLKKPLFTALDSLELRYLSTDVWLGFGDPAATGITYGWFWVIKGMLAPLGKVRMNMVPAFNRCVLEGEAELSLAIQKPLLIMLASAWAMTKKPVRDLIRQEAVQ